MPIGSRRRFWLFHIMIVLPCEASASSGHGLGAVWSISWHLIRRSTSGWQYHVRFTARLAGAQAKSDHSQPAGSCLATSRIEIPKGLPPYPLLCLVLLERESPRHADIVQHKRQAWSRGRNADFPDLCGHLLRPIVFRGNPGSSNSPAVFTSRGRLAAESGGNWLNSAQLLAGMFAIAFRRACSANARRRKERFPSGIWIVTCPFSGSKPPVIAARVVSSRHSSVFMILVLVSPTHSTGMVPESVVSGDWPSASARGSNCALRAPGGAASFSSQWSVFSVR